MVLTEFEASLGNLVKLHLKIFLKGGEERVRWHTPLLPAHKKKKQADLYEF